MLLEGAAVEWCVRFGAGMLVPVHPARCCCVQKGDRSFTSVQMVHTHTHPAFGRVANEVKIRMKWGPKMR